MSVPTARFTPAPHSEATAPPQRRGLTRDGVRLLVARPGEVRHRRFHQLERYLEPGDLLVVNTSATVPAALDTRRADGRRVPVHVSTSLDTVRGWWSRAARTDRSGT